MLLFFLSFGSFIYLFLATWGLRCCTWAFSSCSKWGLLFAVRGLLIGWLLLWQSTGSRHTGFSSCGSRALDHRLSSCGARAELLHGMWDLLRPGLRPTSPALAGRFLTTAPPGKPWTMVLMLKHQNEVSTIQLWQRPNTTLSFPSIPWHLWPSLVWEAQAASGKEHELEPYCLGLGPTLPSTSTSAFSLTKCG